MYNNVTDWTVKKTISNKNCKEHALGHPSESPK